MTTELIALGEYVSNHNGRLTIVDTFDAIYAERFPWRAYFGIAVIFVLTPEDSTKEMLYMRIASERDDSEIFNASTKLAPPPDNKGGKLVIASNVKGLIFPAPGLYHLIISADADQVADFKFEVKGNEEKGK